MSIVDVVDPDLHEVVSSSNFRNRNDYNYRTENHVASLSFQMSPILCASIIANLVITLVPCVPPFLAKNVLRGCRYYSISGHHQLNACHHLLCNKTVFYWFLSTLLRCFSTSPPNSNLCGPNDTMICSWGEQLSSLQFNSRVSKWMFVIIDAVDFLPNFELLVDFANRLLIESSTIATWVLHPSPEAFNSQRVNKQYLRKNS